MRPDLSLQCHNHREICYPLVNQLCLNSSLTTKQLGRLKELVQNYDPQLEAQLARMADQPARWVIVEAVCRFAEYGPGGSEAKPIPRPAREDLDYDQMLNYINPFYDRLAEALGNKDSQQRRQLVRKARRRTHRDPQRVEFQAAACHASN